MRSGSLAANKNSKRRNSQVTYNINNGRPLAVGIAGQMTVNCIGRARDCSPIRGFDP